MAIRKFRKHIKPFIWFITILFIASSAMLAYMNMKSSYSRANVYAFKLDGDKISKKNRGSRCGSGTELDEY